VTRLLRILSLLALALPAVGTNADESSAGGARLYARNCSACHGSDGHGGVGVPLALPAFLSSVDDEYLRITIRRGRPGRVMPAFSQLTDPEVQSIIHYLRSWPGQTPPAPQSREHIVGNVEHGKVLFARNCAACHGTHAEGGHGTGVTMSRPRNAPILAPALNNPGFLAAASDAMIKTTLVRGREGTPMRSFLKQGLKERDINDIVAYVRAFEHASPPASSQVLDTEKPALVRESPYPLAETVDKVKTAIAAANMRLIRIQTLDQGFVPDGKEDQNQVIVYSCDFGFLNEALKVDPRVGLFLPCRVTVVKRGTKVFVMSVNPERLSRIFNNSELNELCERMQQVYEDILDESVM
jgi:cytochrome c oxidase cbb3-type subunit 3